MVRIQMGDSRRGEAGLRSILLSATDARVAFGAAYNLAASLRRRGRHERALAFAARAMESARAIGSPEYLAPVHNLHGNILLNQGRLDEALGAYEQAVALRETQQTDVRFSRAILEDNFGYCLLLLGRLAEGIERIQRALALAEEVGDLRCRAECLQDLCYGLLVQGRFAEAAATGERSLHLAQEGRFADIAENCHYLLGEVGTRTNDHELRDRHFEHLQRLHPEIPFLRDFLCAVDVTGIITLKR
jgi:tetratricopeptide (TPR) repeat protein